MAYGNYLASVPLPQISDLRRDPLSRLLYPTRTEEVSHVLASWVKVQPLGRLLGEALDGGEELAEGLWHPFRAPVVHPPPAVLRLADAVNEAFRTATAEHPVREIDWFQLEIARLLAVFRYAGEHREAIVSALSPPMDAERAAKVRIPFALKST